MIFLNILSILKTAGLVIGGLFLGTLSLFYFFQNKILYIPSAPGLSKEPKNNIEGFRDPSEIQYQFEDVYLTTKDQVKIHGWFIKQKNHQNVPTIVFFHENAGNIGTRLQYFQYYLDHVVCNILIMAYRGYSYSEGQPTEEGLQLDSVAILDFVFAKKDIDINKIFIHGRSLGGAVSIYAQSTKKYRIAGLILENTFTSISNMVDVIFPKLKYFKKIVQRNYWPSIDRISEIQDPMLFIFSLKDEIVPYSQMVTLFDKANQAQFKQKFSIPNGTHNGSWAQDVEGYFNAIRNFIDKCLKKPQKSNSVINSQNLDS